MDRPLNAENMENRVLCKSALSRKDANECKSDTSESAPVKSGIAVPPLPFLRRFQRRVYCRKDLSEAEALLYLKDNIKMIVRENVPSVQPGIAVSP